MKLNQDQIKLEMARQRLTVNELCQKAGVSYLSFSNINAGKQNPRPVTVGKLAYALGVPVEQIIEMEGA